jgi:imidazolonepropionase-like amidohydrolase
MHSSFFRAAGPRVVLAVVAWLAIGPLWPAAAEPVAFVDVHVVPMRDETILEHQTVLVDGGVITAVGAVSEVAVPPSATVVPGAGRYLIPGLADMHVHFNGGREDNARYLKLYLSQGTTTVLCLGGNEAVLAMRDGTAREALAGPTIFSSGPVLGQLRGPKSHAAAMDEVRKQHAAGYDFIKVYNELTAEAYDGVMDAAAETGIPVVGHAVRAVGIGGALARGQHVAHLEEFIYGYFQEGLDASRIDGLVAEVKAAGIYVICTLVAYQTILDQLTDLDAALAAPGVEYISPARLAYWQADKNMYREKFDQAELERRLAPSYAFLEQLARAFQAGGVPMLAGTDATMPVVVPGFGLFRELECLVAAGLRPYDALLSATRRPAEFLRIADRAGTVEAGKRADLVLLEGNPLADIRALRSQAGVMRGGAWMDRTAVQSLLDGIRPTAE